MADMQVPFICNVTKSRLVACGHKNLATWSKKKNHVFIDKPNTKIEGAKQSKWVNLFKTLKEYEQHIRGDEELWDALDDLNNCVLGTWTYPRQSHADVLVRLFCEKHGIENNQESDVDKILANGELNISIKINGSTLSEKDAFAILMRIQREKEEEIKITLNKKPSDRRSAIASLNLVAGTYKPNGGKKVQDGKQEGRGGLRTGPKMSGTNTRDFKSRQAQNYEYDDEEPRSSGSKRSKRTVGSASKRSHSYSDDED